MVQKNKKPAPKTDPVSAKRRGRPRAYQPEIALGRALDLFLKDGFAATSLDDLSAATGMNRPSLYGAFGDKRDLFRRALDDYATTVMAALMGDLRDSNATGIERLATHIRNAMTATTADARRGCLVAKSAAELGATDEPAIAS